MQRLLDILFSLSALIIWSPLFVPIVVVLRFTGEGEVFFRQKRVGRGGVKFDLLKFATMLRDSPNHGHGHRYPERRPASVACGAVFADDQAQRIAAVAEYSVGRDEPHRPQTPNSTLF